MLTVNSGKILLVFPILLLRLNLAVSNFSYPYSDEPELICANILYRHGERNIAKSYSTDPWASESHWPGGSMQLTNRGKQQQYELGQYLRNRYQTLLDKTQGKSLYEIIYVRSTDYDRTLMSAAANLAGMFPPQADEIWNSDLQWQPFPIHSVPLEDDYVLGFSKNCPRFIHEFNKYNHISDERSLLNEHKELLQYLELHSGIAMNNCNNVWSLFDILTIEQARGLELPEWTNYVFSQRSDMEYLTATAIRRGSETPEMCRVKMGFLLREMLKNFRNKIQSNLSADRSICIYSAHDTTIGIFLNALALIERQVPPFCATVLMELYKIGNEFYIQISYKNSEADPMPLHIPSCGLMCPIDKFCDIYDRILPTGDFEDECRMDDESSESEFDIEADVKTEVGTDVDADVETEVGTDVDADVENDFETDVELDVEYVFLSEDDENRTLLASFGLIISISVLIVAVICSLKIRYQTNAHDRKLDGYSTIFDSFKC